MGKIEGGYYLKARKVQNSEIAHAPPNVREIWDWLIKEANYQDTNVCKRGEVFTSFKDIQEGLHWMVGWRKMAYSKHDCERSLEWLRKRTMVTTRKTTRGMFISIVNYAKYQDIGNYEGNNVSNRNATGTQQTWDTIQKETKRKKEEKKRDSHFVPPSMLEVQTYCAERKNGINPQTFIDFYTARGWLIGKVKMKDWKACIRTWEQRQNQTASPVEQVHNQQKELERKAYEEKYYQEYGFYPAK